MNLRVVRGAAGAKSLLQSPGPIVMIDALRMSATVIVALHLGMEVIPVATVKEAEVIRTTGGLTAGERGGKKLPKLDYGNSPTELLSAGGRSGALSGKALALTTSNGIPALLAVAGHRGAVFVGSPLNLFALAARIGDESPDALSLLIAEADETTAQEDAMTAALLLERLDHPIPPELPVPVRDEDVERFFLDTASGKKLAALGYEQDVRLCAGVDRYPIVPVFSEGRVAVSF